MYLYILYIHICILLLEALHSPSKAYAFEETTNQVKDQLLHIHTYMYIC